MSMQHAYTKDFNSSEGTILEKLLNNRKSPLHVIDPYKISEIDAAEKAKVITQIGFPVILIASTDNNDFHNIIPRYLNYIKQATDLDIITHFPPERGKGFPLCNNTDAVLTSLILNSEDRYFREQSQAETIKIMNHSTDFKQIELLNSAAITFGNDYKSYRYVKAANVNFNSISLEKYAKMLKSQNPDIVYLFSRHRPISIDVCRYFRKNLFSRQLLFISGCIKTRDQINSYLQAGADFVVFGGALESNHWHKALNEIIKPPRLYNKVIGDPSDENLYKLSNQIFERINGNVYVSTKIRNVFSKNFGGTCIKKPKCIIRTTCEKDVIETIKISRANSVPIGICAGGQSYGKQALIKEGILIANGCEAPFIKLHDDNKVEVTTRTSWLDLELTLNKANRAMPVLTNHLYTLVGGTLAVGGYGHGSIVHGGQIDQVERLKLILPDGKSIWCSKNENTDYFYNSLASLGQLGFVEKVIMKTIPYCKPTRLFIKSFPTLYDMVKSTMWMGDTDVPSVDFFMSQHYEDKFISTYGIYKNKAETDFFPLPKDVFSLSSNDMQITDIDDWPLKSLRKKRRTPWLPDHYFVWADYSLDVHHVLDFVKFLEKRVFSNKIYNKFSGRLLILAISHPENKHLFNFEPVSPDMKDLAYGFGLYFRIPVNDKNGLEEIFQLHRDVLHACVELEGRPYLAGWYDLNDTIKQKIYGSALEDLKVIKKKIDPHNLFNPGILI